MPDLIVQGAVDLFPTITVNGQPPPDLLPEQVLPTDSIHGSSHPNPKQGAVDLFTTTTVNGRPHMPDLLPEQVLPNDSIHGGFHDIAITSLSGEAQGDSSELLASVLLLQACW
jgi:hypothetical protein